MPALVESERRPAARGAGAAEVTVVLLARPRAVNDHHGRPRRRRVGEPEHVRAPLVRPRLAWPGNCPPHRLDASWPGLATKSRGRRVDAPAGSRPNPAH